MKFQNLLVALVTVCILLQVCACSEQPPSNGPNTPDATDTSVDSHLPESPDLTEETAKQDPHAVLTRALQNTFGLYFSNSAQLGKIAAESFQHGSVSVVLNSDTLLGDISEIGCTLYANGFDREYAAEMQVTLNDQTVSALAFLNANGLYVNGEDVLGSEKTVGIDFSRMKEFFPDSEFADLLSEWNSEAVALISDFVLDFDKQYRDLLDSDKETKDLILKTVGTACNREISIPTDVDGGLDETCLSFSYTIDSASILASIHLLMDEFDIHTSELTALLQKAETLFSQFEPQIVVTLILNRETYTFQTYSASVEIADLTTDQRLHIDEMIQFSEDLIDANFSFEDGNMRYSLHAPLTISDENGILSYRLQITVGRNNLEIQLLDAVYSYAQASRTVLLSTEISTGVNTRISGSLVGTVSSSEEEAVLSFHSFRFNGRDLPVSVKVSFFKDAAVPSVPDDPADLTTMTKADLDEIIKEFKSSVLGTLIFGDR